MAAQLAPFSGTRVRDVIEIRETQGRYEVFSPGWHWEVFEGRLGAQAAALGLAGEIHRQTGEMPKILAPWPVYPSQPPPRAA